MKTTYIQMEIPFPETTKEKKPSATINEPTKLLKNDSKGGSSGFISERKDIDDKKLLHPRGPHKLAS